ncbi:LytTR family DNA-binding domain-containing protein [Weeksellaceae bacterium KMM 9713]|uniref:LytTR family DNA-binding domain-containing protein n=1 Tax=Profundicola chukchiensis TaxID=2961959 RepID=A0A9X4MXB3_9FLAO|nr:LytTR family DNA-binding domain-containing protein [Profundicola chukchiensis]MDG4945250.1 LytTR family DNA-binding domain-containing protein [Profundicola chukchiensis]
MRVAIIDDELHCIESLEITLVNLFPSIDIVYKSSKVEKAIAELKEKQIDLLFLDIEMPGMSGFQFLENFVDRDFDVIFTTAYSEYAIEAFKTHAISYLLKPIDETELLEAVGHWRKTRDNEEDVDQDISELISHLKREGFMKSKISVPVAGGYRYLEVDNIIYCQSQSNYTNIFLLNGKSLLISKTLKTINELLKPFYFIRVHKSYLINPNFLVQYSRSDGGYVVMKNQTQIPVSKDKREVIINLFKA